MHSTPNTKPRIAYLARGQSQSKSKKQSMTSSVQKAKSILGDQPLGLYSHSNQSNLDYLSSQIQLKKKEKERARKKLESQEKQRVNETKQQESYSMSVENTILEIDASQEETQRSQEEAAQVKSEIERELKMQELRVPSLEEQINKVEQEQRNKQDQNPSFINFFDNYIDILQQQPFIAHSPSSFNRKSSSRDVQKILERDFQNQPYYHQSYRQSPRITINKSLKQSLKQPMKYSIQLSQSKIQQIQQHELEEKYRELERRYEREVNHGPLLISKLQDYRRIEEQQKDEMMSLQEKIELATKEVEKLRRLKQKHVKNRDLIRNVLINQQHTKGSSRVGGVGKSIGAGNTIRLRERERERQGEDSVSYQYETFKSSTHRPMRR